MLFILETLFYNCIQYSEFIQLICKPHEVELQFFFAQAVMTFCLLLHRVELSLCMFLNQISITYLLINNFTHYNLSMHHQTS